METVEGTPRPPRRHTAAPAYQFGRYGELTPRTIAQAGLTGEEKKRAYEIMKVQAAFTEIFDTIATTVDPDGAIHDLAAIPATHIALAHTLAMAGFRRTAPAYIKKRHGIWVDARLPDDDIPAPSRPTPPPGAPPEGWHTPPKITIEEVPR